MDEQNQQVAPVKRRRYSEEFKQDAARLVGAEGYTFKAAAEAVGISDQTLRAWQAKLAPQPQSWRNDATLGDLQTRTSGFAKRSRGPSWNEKY